VDETIMFHRLRLADMGRIVDIQLDRMRRLLEDRKIEVVLTDDGREWLAQRGYDPAYGARPLKRVIQKHVQDTLAEKILMGEIREGDAVELSGGSDRLLVSRRGSTATLIAAE
jgi:ATP-dependent Clp protease ATP-binding subunit ClpB